MIRKIKAIIKKIISFMAWIVFKTKVGKVVSESFIKLSMNDAKEIDYKGIKFKFITPNSINRFRIDTFATKEPETLEWIDSFKKNTVFWDIGANIGLYSCYAAKVNSCKVFAFEPSIFNLELLGRNIFLNKLVDKIIIIPIPLNDKLLENTLNMSSTEWGGSQSTFAQDYTYDGSNLIKNFEFKTVGVSMDEAISLFQLPSPDYIKIDVDGKEHLILKGGINTLKNVKSLLVEVDEKFEIQKKNTTEYLKKSGFVLKDKKHSKLFDGSKYESCFNQIWNKN